jgi:hypothetical protein
VLDVAALLRETFPEVAARSVVELGEGWDHVAYLVDDELVFRLPWAVVEAAGPPPGAAAEVALLRAVAGRLPVTVPEPLHVAPGDAWFGYRYLRGEPVQGGPLPDGFAALAVDTIIAIEDAPRGALPVWLGPGDDDHAVVASLAGRGVVAPVIDAAVQRALATRAERWPAAVERRLVPLHADLGLDHWLVADDGAVSLIDWSDAVVGPPETQLRTLMWDEPALAAEVIARYRDATGVDVDLELVLADGLIQAYTDLAELTAEGDDDTGRCHWFLAHWVDVGVDGLR